MIDPDLEPCLLLFNLVIFPPLPSNPSQLNQPIHLVIFVPFKLADAVSNATFVSSATRTFSFILLSPAKFTKILIRCFLGIHSHSLKSISIALVREHF